MSLREFVMQYPEYKGLISASIQCAGFELLVKYPNEQEQIKEVIKYFIDQICQ